MTAKKNEKKQPVATQPPVVEEEAIEIPLDEAARLATTFMAYLRENNASGDSVQSIAQSATMARAHIGDAEGPKAEAGEEAMPTWAQKVTHSEALFVKETPAMELWHAIDKPISKDSSDVLVSYERSSDQLTPGGTEVEQAVALKKVDNRFSSAEWEQVVKPILDRYVKALELKKLARLMDKEKEETTRLVKDILPQVFHQEEIKTNEVDATSQKFRRQIIELVDSINTNPEVLKGWILEQLNESPKAIMPHVSDKGKNPYAPFQQMQRKMGVKSIRQNFQSETAKMTLEDYANQLADKISKLGGQLLMLNTKYSEGAYFPPEVKKDYIETPYMKRALETLSQKAVRQLEQKKGMISIIGDMGTGKNYAVEHFAAKTNRPFFYCPCSRSMDAADLAYHMEFRYNETQIMLSQLAKGLKTKNSVILIDEPNSLPPEVVSSLHGLADHNRTFVYNGSRFQAAEGVIIVMTMNPATYSHVKDLPEAFSDRTLGLDMYLDYPPLSKQDELAQNQFMSSDERQTALQQDNDLDKKFVCDEALILRTQFPRLKDWNEEDFTKLWDVVVNEGSAALLGERAKELDKVKSDVDAILKILKICDAWRKQYKAGEMQRTISLRGSTAVADNYIRLHDVRKAFLDLYKPNSLKYDGGDLDYQKLEKVLNDKGELEKIINKEIGV